MYERIIDEFIFRKHDNLLALTCKMENCTPSPKHFNVSNYFPYSTVL